MMNSRIGMGLVAALMCSACSTVKSVDVGAAAPDKRTDAYFNYAVSKSLIVVQLASPDSSGAAPAAKKDTAGTGQTLKITGTVTATSGGAAADGSSDSGGADATPADDASECAILKTQYKASLHYFSGQIKDYTALIVDLPALGAQAKDDPAARTKLVDRVTKYNAAASERLQNSLDARHVLATLKEACPIKPKVTLSQQIVPDWKRTFAVKANVNWMYSDQWNLKIDSNGLLTSASVASKDESVGVASTLAGLAGEFLVGPGLPGVPDQALALLPGPKAVRLDGAGLHNSADRVALPPPPCSGPRPTRLAVEDQLKRDDDKMSDGDKMSKEQKALLLAELHKFQEADLNYDLAQLKAATCAPLIAGKLGADIADVLPRPGTLPPLPGTGEFPITLTLGLDQLDADQGGAAKRLANYDLTLVAACSPITSSPDKPYDLKPTLETGVYDGLIMSSARSCNIQVRRKGQDYAVATQTFWVQDSSHLRAVPLKRVALITHTIGYDFAGGVASDVAENRPSVVAAAVAIPGDLVGAFFSGVTSAFTTRKGVIDNQSGNISAQTGLVNAQTANLKAQADLKKAQDGN